ncbi:hypothetical protein PWG14_24995, partial [Chromobacterium amazonense]|uniref:hypothetical protein n=1 Tax=Chromobacterium amazonense TaxID=1382803 RepID=UPI00237E3182
VHGGYGINRFGKRGNSSCLGFVQQSPVTSDFRLNGGGDGVKYQRNQIQSSALTELKEPQGNFTEAKL